MCSIVYEPCDENSFKIGPPGSGQLLNDDEGSGFSSDTSVGRADECNDRIVMPCDSEEFITVSIDPGKDLRKYFLIFSDSKKIHIQKKIEHF